MPKRIYVGNLPFSASDQEVRELFGQYGTVDEVNLITDRETGRPRGFGFVEMSEGADEAIEALHQSDMGGRSLNVNEARPRQERPRGGGGGGGGYGGRPHGW
ncbi:MAG: RNA-binding protein [Acidobacteriota bacterium]